MVKKNFQPLLVEMFFHGKILFFLFRVRLEASQADKIRYGGDYTPDNMEPPNGCFSKIGVPENGWFTMENPTKIDYLGVPLFLETPKWRLYKGLHFPDGFQTPNVLEV